jgi:hypothetical protein
MPKSNRAFYDGKILHSERDLQLGLKAADWPRKGCPLGQEGEVPPLGAEPWQQHDGYLYRTITPKHQPLWEAMLRFPNAPIYGLRPRQARLHQIKERSNFHTFRVIGLLPDSPDDEAVQERRIRDVYILHNGLNETKDSELHYQLASRLLEHSDRPAVCILRPFPGHLTRYPFSDEFAERPLDTFLLDSGDLFRQFIRFMLETRWLLSILVPRRRYNVLTGGKLVACKQPEDSGQLAKRVVAEWEAMHQASKGDPQKPRMKKLDVTQEAVHTTIDVLREQLLHWGEIRGSRIPEAAKEESPAVHMVGYSLGGFLAQSAFFAWPYAISSCVTLFGGGELRKLAPTAFAQPEEWQSVLHSLRYELDRAMGGSLRSKAGRVGGVNQETFEYLLRVFYEVFLQYYQGSYKTRLAEFIQRMLFVTGGQDPIVRPDNILEAAPTEGVNLINIAGMSHFPMKPKERVQREQREFWLEQLGQIIPAFAEQGDERRRDALHRSWLNDAGTNLHKDAERAYKEYKDQLDRIGEPPSSGVVTSGVPLSDRWFGKEIEHICDFIYHSDDEVGHTESELDGGRAGRKRRVQPKGWVLVSRNEIPPVFQSADVLRRYAAGLHHSEDLAADEFWLALKRRTALENGRARVTLMVTDTARALADHREKQIFPSRSETPGVARLSPKQHRESREYFAREWSQRQPDAVRTLVSGEFKPNDLGQVGGAVAKNDQKTPIQVRFLPDAWIGIDQRLLRKLEDLHCPPALRGRRRRAERAVVEWGAGLAQERVERASKKRKRPINGILLEDALEHRTISIVEFSRAGLNPRYRGQRLTNSRRAADVLIHWALAFEASVTEDQRDPASPDLV